MISPRTPTRKSKAGASTPQAPHLPAQLEKSRLVIGDGAEFFGTQFSADECRGITANHVVCEQVSLHNVRMLGAVIEALRLSDVRAVGVDFSAGRWVRAHLSRVELVGCKLTGLVLREARIDDLVMRECILEGMTAQSSILRTMRVERSDLRNVLFDHCTMEHVVFRGCNLEEADFAESLFKNIDMRGSAITGARLTPRQMEGMTIDPAQALEIAASLGMKVRAIEERP